MIRPQHRLRRGFALATLAVAVATVAVACGKAPDYRLQVERAMTATAALSRSFVYTDSYQGKPTTVQGEIADDFRYKALVSVAGTPVFQEVVADDAVADQAITQTGLQLFLRSAAQPATGAPGTATGATTGSAAADGSTPAADPTALLAAHQWVEDDHGAPSLLATAAQKHPLGEDPIFDALTVFRYTDTAMRQAVAVVKFNKDSLSYKPKEDPFPQPKQGSGVTRYDLILPKIPKVSQSLGNQAVPTIANFRKMSIYVKNGLVVQILEDVDVVSRLGDLQKNYNLKFGSSDPQQQADEAITAINAVDKAQGNDLIRNRSMSIKFTNVGQPVTTDMPTQTMAASLTVLRNRGYFTPQQQAAAAQAGTAPTG